MRKNAVVIKPTQRDNIIGQASCGRKQGYTKKEAQHHARIAAKRGSAKRMGVYECPYAPHWHITHIVTLARP